MQVEALVEAPAVHGGGLALELGLHALVHQREQLLHVAVVRALGEHLAQRLDVPRAQLAVTVRHQACHATQILFIVCVVLLCCVVVVNSTTNRKVGPPLASA